MKNKTITDNRARRYIRIEKDYLWDKIDMLSTVDRYNKSFNKIIIEALEVGLPKLLETHLGIKEFEENSSKNQAKNYNEFHSNMENYQDENHNYEPQKEKGSYENQVLRLLHEVIINELLIRDNVNSLFEAKNLELHGKHVDPQYFERGHYNQTPKFQEAFEIRELSKLAKWRE